MQENTQREAETWRLARACSWPSIRVKGWEIRLPKGDEISSYCEPHCTGIAGSLPDSCCPLGFVYPMKQPIIRESRSDSVSCNQKRRPNTPGLPRMPMGSLGLQASQAYASKVHKVCDSQQCFL